MLWAVFVVILILWFLGLVTQVAGGMIHLLLVAAVAVVVWNSSGGIWMDTGDRKKKNNS